MPVVSYSEYNQFRHMPKYRYQHGDRPLDGYTIERALGRGGFGEVYFAISDADLRLICGRQVPASPS